MDEDDVTIEQDSEGETGGSEEELEATEVRAETKITKLRKELEQAKKEKQENLDGWQRAKADYVNALKRFEEEKRAAVELGTLKAAMAFLSVIDSLERAKNAGELPEGFAGILKQLEDAAGKLGLEQFGEVGEKFNPMLHEALGQDSETNEGEEEKITAILEPGWKQGDYIVRPARVRVGNLSL